jgi:ATP-dependent DNA ligase
MKIIYPPRPKGKIPPQDLPYYEDTGKWLAQRKFRGSRAVINVSSSGKVTLGNRHGTTFSRFSLDKKYAEEFLSLNLKSGIEYWLDGELMNKDVNSTNEIILFDVLQVGRYFFSSPNQQERLEILKEICFNPQDFYKNALRVTDRILMAETFSNNFVKRFQESLPIPQIEGLVLRKKNSTLDNFGNVEYETTNLIRCRKQFGVDTPKDRRSGGYEF